MADVIILPPCTDDDKTEVFNKISPFSCVSVETVGRWFESVFSNQRARHTSSAASLDSESSDEEDVSVEEEHPDEVKHLQSLDPKDWKNQDHYRVLGLHAKRYRATENDIKRAYRRKVLLHHPDKRKTAGEKVQDLDHDYFSCITKAYEILGVPAKRRSYDSIDPEFDNEIPQLTNGAKQNFYAVFTPVFESNARWSTKRHVPRLGDDNATRDEVDKFYHFWYNFDSWREYSYLDEEEKEKGENRDERRWIEKQNKAARQRLKKEEMQRIRQLVDTAYACDPRVQRFKEEDKEKKLAQKRAKQEAARLKAEEEERARQERLEIERLAREQEEENTRQQREKEKREKENLKKQLKKERKTLETLCSQGDYYAKDEEERVLHLQQLDKLCKLLTLQKLQDMNESLQSSSEEERRGIFLKEVKELDDRLEQEKAELISASQKSSANQAESHGGQKAWPADDIQLLVKAVNLFPAGTTNRWEVVAAFINQHSTSGIQRNAKEVLAKAKNLQRLDPNLKEEANKKAYEQLEKTVKKGEVAFKDESTPSERFDTPADLQGLNPSPWTAEEQRLLEQALKTYSSATPDRWDRIADCIPNRSKKDCIRRYKELVDMVRIKKAAQAAAAQATGRPK
ncbi:dnaJ homolog subfamily C member 2-like [Ornithodoros turicata]|uniref:dnaJ homolog subfamily C member 2-like n=1 Tax=Ornithodoros turicata TaxID=34597 RepID=UPI003138B95B